MHDGILAVVVFEKLEQEREVGLPTVDKRTQIFIIFVYFSNHDFEKISIVSLIFFFFEDVLFRDELFLVDFDEKEDQIEFFFDSFE